MKASTPMSFCRIKGGPPRRGFRLAFLLANLAAVSLITLLTATSAYADTGDEWVFGAHAQVWPDAVESQQFADIDGNRVVWQGRSTINNLTRDRIFFRDISSESNSPHLLVYSTTQQQRPRISGNLVVWLEGSTQKVIRYTHLGGGCPESGCIGSTPANWNSSARPVEVAISGSRIVWTDERTGSGSADIYLFDLGQPGLGEQLVSKDAQGQPAPGRQDSPAIDGDWVAWDDSSGVHARNLATGQEFVNAGNSPAISGERLIYRSLDGNGFWLWDLASPTGSPAQISGSAGANPDIDGDYVVWSSSGSPARVRLYDIATATEQEVTSREGSVYHPAVAAQDKGPRLVWTDDRVNPRNIYSARAEMRLRDLWALMGIDTCCGAVEDPVNTATGAFYYSHTDIDIPTRGLPLSIERTYNSNDRADSPFGYGWSFNWQMDAVVESGGDVVVRRGDGRRDTFTLKPDGSYSAPAGRHDTLIKNPDSTYTLVTRGKVTYSFDGNGRLASVTTAAGQQTLLTYEGGRLKSIAAPDGRELSISWDADRIVAISWPHDSGTYTVAYSYSSAGDLTAVTDQNGGLTAYEYDASHRMTAIRDPNATALEPDGDPFVENVYDAEGRVREQRDAGGDLMYFDYAVPYQTTITRVIDPNDPAKNQVRVHYHDASWRLVRETDALGLDTTYEYDAAGNRYKMIDRRGTVTRQVFDASGNVTDIYRAEGLPEEEHTQTTYSSMNRPLTFTDARGQTTSYSYDASGLLLIRVDLPPVSSYDGSQATYSEQFSYNADGLVASVTDRNGDTTTFTYDAYGYPDSVTRNANRAPEEQELTDYDYDDLGRKIAETSPAGNTTSYSYNADGDLLSVTGIVTSQITGLPLAVVTSYSYDANGNRTAITDPENNTTSFEYSAMNNLRLTTDASGNTIEHTYDAAGNRTATKDRNGSWTYFGYDRENRLTTVEDPEHNMTAYGYDAEGNRTTLTDPLANTVTTSYDGLGRVSAVTEPDEGGASRTTSYTYDPGGNIVSETDPLLNSSTYAYDELGRLKQQVDPTGYATSFAYDGMGNRVKEKDPRGFETSYAFDASDRLTGVTDPLGGITAYGYDLDGNLVSQRDPLGHTTHYGYDELGRLTSEKVDDGAGGYLIERSYAYDKGGNLVSDTTGEGTISYSYDQLDNLTGVTDRQGATYSYTYDANQNQLSATDNASGKTVSYSYTARGQIDTYSDAHGASQSFSYNDAGLVTAREDMIASQQVTTSYEYTPRNQQKSVTRGGETTSYAYDPAGRLASRSYPNGVLTTYSYDAAGRLTAQEATRDAQVLQSYTQAYDPAGNLLSSTEAGTGVSTYAYDGMDRLTAENIAGYGTNAYTYDATGNRLTLTEPKPAGGPSLTISITRVYWASYQEWLDHKLSVDYRIRNQGPGSALATSVTNATATRGVYPLSDMPIMVGDIAQGAYAPATLKYYLPAGVGSFQTTVYATCKNAAGADFYYPEKRSFYSYNEANQLTGMTAPGGERTSYSYDRNGALTEKSDGTDATTMTYDGMDRLTRVATPSETVNYGYDALGRRITRGVGASTANRHLNAAADTTAYETNAGGALTSEMLSGAGGLISVTDYSGTSPTTSYYHYNPHGDTSAITDSNGSITDTYRYDAFGNELTANDTAYGYTGKWQRDTDAATGLIRMGVRDYDPALGRFISTDPLKGSMSDPQTRNRYGYALNNPLTVYDLDGRVPWTPVVTDPFGGLRDEAKDAGADYGTAAGMFIGWATGTADENIEYGPDSIQVQDLKDSPTVQKVREKFCSDNGNQTCGDSLKTSVLRGEEAKWMPWDHLRRIGHPVENFAGSFDTVTVTPHGDGTVTITAVNKTGMHSFSYHVLPDYSRETFPLGGDTYQVYTWREQIVC